MPLTQQSVFNNLQLTASAQTMRQIQGKLEFARKREAALVNLHYGVTALDN